MLNRLRNMLIVAITALLVCALAFGFASAESEEPEAVGASDSRASGNELTLKAMLGSYVDAAKGRIYTASKDATVGILYQFDMNERLLKSIKLPESVGTWEITKTGGYIVVGNGSTVVALDDNGNIVRKIKLPGTKQIMSLCDDEYTKPRNSGVVYVGTYDTSGGRFFHVNLNNGDCVQIKHFPDKRWVRSLTSSKAGVMIGVGAPAKTYRYTTAAITECDGKITDGSAFAFSQAKAEYNNRIYCLVGTENQAGIRLVDCTAGGFVYKTGYNFDANTISVDRITADNQNGVFYFTAKPSGTIYKVAIKDMLEGNTEPVMVGTPRDGAEMRQLQVVKGSPDRLYSLDNVSTLGVFNLSTGEMSVKTLLTGSGYQSAAAQALQQWGEETAISGHAKVQINGKEIDISTEAKQLLSVEANGCLYAAAYPSAFLYRIDKDMNTQVTLLRNIGDPKGRVETRPAALVYSENLDRLMIPYDFQYGAYGGSIVSVNLDGGDRKTYYPDPTHKVTKMIETDNSFILGTSSEGEMQAAPAGVYAKLINWRPAEEEVEDSEDNDEAGDAELASEGASEATATNEVEAIAESAEASTEKPSEILWSKDLYKDYGVKATTIRTINRCKYAGMNIIVIGTNNKYLLGINEANGNLLWKKSVGDIYEYGNETKGDYNLITIDGIAYKLRAKDDSCKLTNIYDLTSTSFSDLYKDKDGHMAIVSLVQGSSHVIRYNLLEKERVYGKSRVETAIEVSEEYIGQHASSNKVDSMIVANGTNFADGLSASYLSVVKEAPILLITTPQTEDQIIRYMRTRLKSGGNVYLAGGTGVVSESFESKAKSAGYNVTRLGGRSRFDTNVKILDEAGLSKDGRLIVAKGSDYPDALSASALGIPVMLINDSTKELTEEQLRYLESYDGNLEIYTLGGILGGGAMVQFSKLRLRSTAQSKKTSRELPAMTHQHRLPRLSALMARASFSQLGLISQTL